MKKIPVIIFILFLKIDSLAQQWTNCDFYNQALTYLNDKRIKNKYTFEFDSSSTDNLKKVKFKQKQELFFFIEDSTFDINAYWMKAGFGELFEEKTFLWFSYDTGVSNLRECLFPKLLHKFIMRSDSSSTFSTLDEKTIKECGKISEFTIERIFFSRVLIYKNEFCLLQLVSGGKSAGELGSRGVYSFVFKRDRRNKKWEISKVGIVVM